MTSFIAPSPFKASTLHRTLQPHPGTISRPARMTVAAAPPTPAQIQSPQPKPHQDAEQQLDVIEEPVTLIDGTQQYLDAVALSHDKLVVLKVFAPWCRSCRALQPKVNRLARELPDISFFKLDYEKNKELCYRLGVSSMPTFLFYYGAAGEIEKFSCGPMRADIIREKIDNFQNGQCDYEV